MRTGLMLVVALMLLGFGASLAQAQCASCSTPMAYYTTDYTPYLVSYAGGGCSSCGSGYSTGYYPAYTSYYSPAYTSYYAAPCSSCGYSYPYATNYGWRRGGCCW